MAGLPRCGTVGVCCPRVPGLWDCPADAVVATLPCLPTLPPCLPGVPPPCSRLAVERAGDVFMTDDVLATLMCAPRSTYPWDIVITKRGDVLVFDKRTNSSLDFLTVGVDGGGGGSGPRVALPHMRARAGAALRQMRPPGPAMLSACCPHRRTACWTVLPSATMLSTAVGPLPPPLLTPPERRDGARPVARGQGQHQRHAAAVHGGDLGQPGLPRAGGAAGAGARGRGATRKDAGRLCCMDGMHWVKGPDGHVWDQAGHSVAQRGRRSGSQQGSLGQRCASQLRGGLHS